MRANSYVGKILSVSPIPDADRIEAVEVVCGKGGKWAGVVKKGEFQKGYPCAVFLPDALLPSDNPDFSFMEKSKFIVRQARFRGARSEVLVLPYPGLLPLGEPLDEVYKVRKYEKPVDPSIAGDVVGEFPTAILPKTDEPNFQIVPEMVSNLVGKYFYATEKADGSSGTAFVLDGKLRVCSRNYELKESPKTAGWILAKHYGLAEKLPEGMAVQFEMLGNKIQGNPMGINGLDMRVFNLYSITDRQYRNFADLKEFCAKNGLPMVAVVEEGQLFQMSDAHALQAFARGTYPNGKPREGVVIRPMLEQRVNGERLSFKVINLEYKN